MPRSPSEVAWMASVAIIGAGPHGLSVAAHLDDVGIESTVFGSPMAFWEGHMPRGMLLRSSWRASSIASPSGRLSLERYERSVGLTLERPVRLDDFVRYGRWFADQLGARRDSRRVAAVDRAPGGFLLRTDDGEQVEFNFVVVAAGIDRFAHVPPELADIPRSLMCHTLTCRNLEAYAGRRVAVIGGGQSALEYAALLHEVGAQPVVVARASTLRWLHEPSPSRTPVRGALRAAVHPPTGVGPRGLSWVAALPDIFRPLPLPARLRVMNRCLAPVGASWLRPRLSGVSCKLDCHVRSATSDGDTVRLMLSDGTTEEADHVLVATGYRVDVARYPFLTPELLRQVHRTAGHPVLRAGLESSVPGLHFVGAAAGMSFGPVMRFVVGSWYTGASTADRISARRGPRLRRAYPLRAAGPRIASRGAVR